MNINDGLDKYSLRATSETCQNTTNRTVLIFNTYEGIPENLLLNTIAWIVLLLLFTILRKQAWDYGRLALVQAQSRWTQLFYSTTEEVSAAPPQNASGTGNHDLDTNSIDSLLKLDQHFCSWIYAVFKVTDERVEAKCGPDALHYLSFQKHLLILTAFITVISLTIVLPINFQGTLQGNSTTFGHTTVSNLESNNPLLWVHVVLAFIYIPLTFYIMGKCTGRVPNIEQLSKTLMVTNIAQAHRNRSDIFHYFRLLFKDIQFKNVELAYNVSRLTELVDELQCVTNARQQAENYMRRTNNRLRINRYGCGFCCQIGQEDALDYYTAEEQRLIIEVDQERSRALAQPLGIAFVTVMNAEQANYIVRKFQPGTSRNWVITHAPAPSDIFWQNLGVKTRFWYLKAIFLNTLLFLLLFFLTTPAIIVTSIDSFYIIQGIYEKVNPLISEFLPTLLLCTMSSLLPVLVSYSDQWLAYWTRSKQNYNVMQKTFFFLLFMILILPSLGLTSAQAFVEWSLEPNNQTVRWECVFLPDKGAFFVNYVITSGLIGTGLELIRFPELFMYVWYMVKARSPAEIVSIRKAILSEYTFGVHYAWTLVVFTITITYSLICPLITPFGLMYLALRHFVDRYNLYFAYGPTNMLGMGGEQIHASAVYLVRVALVLVLATMASFTIVRGGVTQPMAIVTLVGFIVTLIFMFCFLKPCQARINRAMFEDGEDENSKVEDIELEYVAPVLHPNHFFEGNEAVQFPVAQNYGSAVVTPQEEDMNRVLLPNITL